MHNVLESVGDEWVVGALVSVGDIERVSNSERTVVGRRICRGAGGLQTLTGGLVRSCGRA